MYADELFFQTWVKWRRFNIARETLEKVFIVEEKQVWKEYLKKNPSFLKLSSTFYSSIEWNT